MIKYSFYIYATCMANYNQTSYLSRLSRIISVEKILSCGEISDFCKEFEQFMAFYRNLCRFCSKSVWRKKWQIWGLILMWILETKLRLGIRSRKNCSRDIRPEEQILCFFFRNYRFICDGFAVFQTVIFLLRVLFKNVKRLLMVF